MHELSIASSVVDRVGAFLEAHPVGKVVAVRLAIGELMAVEREQLRFSYEVVTQGTCLAESALEIEEVTPLVRCPHCHFEGAPRYWKDVLYGARVPTLQCPGCGKAAELTRGNECAIQSIRYVE